MKIWIDGQCLQTASRRRGIGRYVLELLRALRDHCADTQVLISFNAAMADEALDAQESVRDLVDRKNVHVWQGLAESAEYDTGYSALRRFSEMSLAHHVACLAPDIALSASPFEGFADNAVPLLQRFRHRFPLAAISYDFIPLRFPEKYLDTSQRRTAFARRVSALRKMDALLAISQFSADETRQFAPGPRIGVIDGAVSPSLLKLDATPSNTEPYILYVGGLDWRKNLDGLIAAYAQLPPALRQRYDLVVVGDVLKAQLQLQQVWRQHLLPDHKLKLLGLVDDEGLSMTYRQASLVVQPSRLEGFGLTALEAMTFGVPLVASNTGALREIVVQPDALFDPNDPKDIAAKIERVLTDKDLARRLVEFGRRRAAEYSWERVAKAVRRHLGDVIAANRSERATVSQTRLTTRALVSSKVPASLAADTLAAAEPRSVDIPRLFIDVTVTALHDHGTGIQRVVKKIGRYLSENTLATGKEPVLAYCDSASGFFPAGGKNGEYCPPDMRHPQEIEFTPGDHVLMLDSNWAHPTYLRPLLTEARLRGCEVTSTLYDLVPLQTPAFCDPNMPGIFAEWLKAALVYSNGFVCISKTVADDLLALLTAIKHPRPIRVGYWRLGADIGAESRAPPVRRNKPLFLTVGTIEPRKGHRVALEAFEILWRDGVEATLYIAGRRGWNTEHLIKRIETHPEFGKRLIWQEAPTDAELSGLYTQCDALIASSYAEGFGLPIVEAIHHSKPVIASDIAVFKEVASDFGHAAFFKTGSPGALADAVRSFLKDGRAVPTGASRNWLTWSESADELRNVILEDAWYTIYQPEPAHAHINGIGKITIDQPLAAHERQHTIDLIEGPIPMHNRDVIRYIVCVANLSSTVWSSNRELDGRLGVFLSHRLLDAGGEIIAVEGGRTAIPLVLCPGDEQYMAVEIDIAWCETAAYAEIFLLQEGVAHWDETVRLPLQKQSSRLALPQSPAIVE